MKKTYGDLAQGVLDGDEAAMQHCFLENAPRIWSLLFRLSGDEDVAADLTQDTFLHGFRKIARFDGRGSLGGWFARIALNLWKDHERLNKRRTRLLEREMTERENSVAWEEPLINASLFDSLHRAVQALAEEYRLVLLLHDVEGYSHAEIGVMLRIAEGSSRARLSRARAMIRQQLESAVEEAQR